MNHVTRWFLLVPALAVFMPAYFQNPPPSGRGIAKPNRDQSTGPQQPTSRDQQGTEKTAVVVKLLPTPKTEAEAAQEAQDRADRTANDRKLVEFTRDLVIVTAILAAIGLLQLVVFGVQARRLRQTVDAAAEQSKAMERSIAEANRLASAMEGAAKDIAVSAKAATDSVAALKERTAQQMRAYLCVVVGSGLYQERAKNIKFQAQPMIVNTGHTPAHKVSVSANAAILPIPLPDDFAFPLPVAPNGASVIGPQQNTIVSPIVEDFCADTDVEKIKRGNEGKALYAWGIVTYDDVFGEPQHTKFCQIITWLPDGKIFGYFLERHNDAT